MLFDVFVMKATAAPRRFNDRVLDNFIKILPRELNFHISWKADTDTVLCMLWLRLYNERWRSSLPLLCTRYYHAVVLFVFLIKMEIKNQGAAIFSVH